MSTSEIDRSAWDLDPETTYLNHGSFGPTPRRVIESRERWSRRLAAQPMRFLVREMEQHLDESLAVLANFIGTSPRNLVFVDNATYGMNVAARSIPLGAGDRVIVTDHEYGAVMRIWRERCRETGAAFSVQSLPDPLGDVPSLVNAFFDGVTSETRVIVLSHVTSQTAAIFPVKEICRAARRRNIAVCIDGPHAIAMVPVNLDDLDCDFYCASGHKWLSAPIGSGFLYVAPRWQHRLVPPIISWGGSVSGRPACWQDEFLWQGTRDPAGFLAVADAVRFLETAGVARFREHGHRLAAAARAGLQELTGLPALLPDSPDWYGTMIAMPIPGEVAESHQHGRRDPLQTALWRDHGIEVPVYAWKRRRFLRVSCHLYNTDADVEKLLAALRQLL